MMKRFGFNEHLGLLWMVNYSHFFEEKHMHGGADEHHLLAFGEESKTVSG